MKNPRALFAAFVLCALAAGIGWARTRATAPADAHTQGRERAATPAGMVYVPGGLFTQGTNDPDADEDVRPIRRVFVPSFYIDRTEVTNRDFRRFRPGHIFPPSEDALPVTNLLYDDCAAYARWAGKRLPTEAEWEKAARGTDGRRYPWGDDWDAARVTARAPRPGSKTGTVATPALTEKNAGQICERVLYSRVRPVGAKPAGASPYGCLDMAGNAWEWVQGFYQNNPEQRIIRGGAVGYGERACRVYARAIEGSGVT